MKDESIHIEQLNPTSPIPFLSGPWWWWWVGDTSFLVTMVSSVCLGHPSFNFCGHFLCLYSMQEKVKIDVWVVKLERVNEAWLSPNSILPFLDFPRRPGFNPWGGKVPWRRERLPAPVLWPREFHGVTKSWTLLSNFQFTSEVPCCCLLWGKTCPSLALQDGCSVQHWGSLSKPIRPHTSYPETLLVTKMAFCLLPGSPYFLNYLGTQVRKRSIIHYIAFETTD